MGVGGATWNTAGTLDLGSDNTFDLADATEDDDGLVEVAWWKYTPATPGLLEMDDHGVGSRVYHGTDADRVSDFPLSGHGNAWVLIEGVEYHIVVGHILGEPPPSGSYELTAAFTPWLTSEWKSDLHDRDDNFVLLPIGNEGRDQSWMLDCVRPGSYRKGDYLITETIGGPWGIGARDCATEHALFGDQDHSWLWNNDCPPLIPGVADLMLAGESSVRYSYSDHTSVPVDLVADTAHMVVNTASFGVWLVPVKENLPESGMLFDPFPEDYGFPPEAQVQYEERYVTLWKVEIADSAGTAESDPDSRYAVNYNKEPDFVGGEWGAWTKGELPGSPVPAPEWATGDAPYSLVFPSEAVDFGDKTFYQLDVPADGFESLTQDYLLDGYDYCVMAGPAEAFSDRDLTADRGAAIGVTVKAYVRSPRFRFIYPGTTSVVRQFPRDDAQGWGSGTRLYPPTKADRTVGGIQ